FDGGLYAVHPRETDVDGVVTVPSVRDLPGPVDLALIGIKAELVPSVLEECVERGVRAALIHAAGFAETATPRGLALQRELEGIADGARLLEVGARARAAGKPIVAFKCGRTDSGARAALSHTASIAGSREIVDAAFARAGIITVDGYDDLIETAVFLSRAKP